MPASLHIASSPPAYTEQDRSDRDEPYTVQKLRLNIDSEAVAQETPTIPESARVDQLRRFLCGALIVDYLDEYRVIDYKHKFDFMRIASYMTDIRWMELEGPSNSTEASHSDFINAEIKIHVENPAVALGIPARVALVMIKQYAAHMALNFSYSGCARAFANLGQWALLYKKATMDECLIIPAVVPLEKATLRKRLQDAAKAQSMRAERALDARPHGLLRGTTGVSDRPLPRSISYGSLGGKRDSASTKAMLPDLSSKSSSSSKSTTGWSSRLSLPRPLAKLFSYVAKSRE